MEAKYQIFGSPTPVQGRNGRIHQLRPIKALVSFLSAQGQEVPAGTVGGYIESEDNLSQTGGAWVDQWAQVYGEAKVYGDAFVGGGSKVYDQAKVGDEVRLLDFTKVYGTSVLAGHTTAYGFNEIGGKSLVRNCDLFGETKLHNVEVDGNWAQIADSSVKNAIVRDDATIRFSTITGSRNHKGVSQLTVEGGAVVRGCKLEGRFTLSGDAKVERCLLKCLDWRYPCLIMGAMGLKSYESDAFHSPVPAPVKFYTPVLCEILKEELPGDTDLPDCRVGLVSYDREAKVYFVRDRKFMTTSALLGWAFKLEDNHPGILETVKAIIAYFQGEFK